MKLPKIHLSEQLKKSITYKEFVTQFGKEFIDSHEPRRQKAIDTEYEKLTGRKANETSRPKDAGDKAKSNDTGSDASGTSKELKA